MNERRNNSLNDYDVYLSEIRSSYEGSDINKLVSFAPVLVNHPEDTSITQSISSEITERGLSTVLNDEQELKTIQKSHNTIEMIEIILDSVNSTLEKLRKVSNVILFENTTSSPTSIVVDTPSSMITDTIITDYKEMEILMPNVLNDISIPKRNMYHRVGSSTSDHITNISAMRRNNLASDNRWCNTRTKVFRSYSDTSMSGNESFIFPLSRTRSITSNKKNGETDDSFVPSGSSTRLIELSSYYERWSNKERGPTTHDILPSNPSEFHKTQPKQNSDSSLQTITTKMSQSDSTVQPIIIIETSSFNSMDTTMKDSTDGQSPEQLFTSYYLKQNTLEDKDIKDNFENEMQEVLMSQRGETSNDISEENHKGMCEKQLHNSPSLVSGGSFIDLINSFIEINQNLNTHIYVEIPNNNDNLEIKTFETKSEIEINSANLQEIFSSDVQDASSEVLSVAQKSTPCFDSKNENSVDLSFTSSTHYINDVFKVSNKKILNYNNYKTLNTIEYQNNKVNSKVAKPARTYTRRGRNNSVNVVESKKIHKNVMYDNVSSIESAGTRRNTLKKKTNIESPNKKPILNISNTNNKMPMRIKAKSHTNSQHIFSKGKGGHACQTYGQKIKQQLQKERILSNSEIMKWVTQSDEQAPVHAMSEEDNISSHTIDLNYYANMDQNNSCVSMNLSLYEQENKTFSDSYIADSFSQQNFKEESSEREFINAVAIIHKKLIGPGPVEPSFVAALQDALKIVLINTQRQSICRDQLSANSSGESSKVTSETGFMNAYPTVDKPNVSEEQGPNIPIQYYKDYIVEVRLQKMFEHYMDSLTERIPCTMGLSKTEDSIQSSNLSLAIWGQPDFSVTTRLCNDRNVTFDDFSNKNQSDVNLLPELDGNNSPPVFDTVLSTNVSEPVKVGPSTSRSSPLIRSTCRRYKPGQVKNCLNYSQNTRTMFKRRSSDESSSLKSESCCSQRLQRLSLPRASHVKNTQYSDALSSDSLERLDRIAATNRPTCTPNREKSLKRKSFSSKLRLGVKHVSINPTCTIKLGGYVFVGADDNYRPPHMSTTETYENSSMGSYRDSLRERVPFGNTLDECKYDDNSTTEEETYMTLNDIQTILKQTPSKSINVVSCHTCVALVKETTTAHHISREYVTVQHLESIHSSYVPHGVQITIILMLVFLFIWLVFRAFSFILP